MTKNNDSKSGKRAEGADHADKAAEAKVEPTVDIFGLEAAFPEVQQFFDFEHADLEIIKDKCIVALDANVLLFPYKMDSFSLEEIEKVYRTLAADKRLFIPAQAGREFLRNRAYKIAEITGYIFKQMHALADPMPKKIGILEESDLYKQILESCDKISKIP